MAFPVGMLKDLSLCLGDQRVAKILMDVVNEAGGDGSGSFTSVVATGAISGATVAGTTSVTTPNMIVTAGGAGSLNALAFAGAATITLVNTTQAAGLSVNDTTSQISVAAPSGLASIYLGAAEASESSYTKRIYTVTGIADNSATNVITVTVPNANHAAAIHLKIISMNGSTDAFESARVATGTIVLARTTGANVVAAAATLTLTGIATVSGGATHTLAYGVTSITGAVGATNTFSITLTIDDSGNLGSNKAIIVAELINSEGTGVTMAAAA